MLSETVPTEKYPAAGCLLALMVENADRKVVGAIGVIGPTRLNYGRVVPIVDYTAQLVGRLVSGRTTG